MKKYLVFAMSLFLLPSMAWADCPGAVAASKCKVSGGHPLAQIKAFQQYVKSSVSGSMSSKAKSGFGTVMERYFAFTIMSQAALNKEWGKLTAEQQTSFVTLFGDMLKKSYLKKLLKHKKYKVLVKGQKIKGAKARVSTALIKIGGAEEDNIDVTYKMMRVKKVWKIYDVVTDEVSLVRNYRSTFISLLKKGGYPALRKHLLSLTK